MCVCVCVCVFVCFFFFFFNPFKLKRAHMMDIP